MKSSILFVVHLPGTSYDCPLLETVIALRAVRAVRAVRVNECDHPVATK